MFSKRATRGRRKSDIAYRIFFATDIHGSDRCFRKFLAAAEVYEVQAVILGGDVAGKAIVPVVARGAGRYEVTFQGRGGVLEGEDLEAIESAIRFNGLYPLRLEPESLAALADDESYRSGLFRETIRDQIDGWTRLAEQRLGPAVRCIITPGNDDPPVVDETLALNERIECPEQKLVEVGPFLLASLGNTGKTPWDTEREFTETELTEQIERMLADADGSQPVVFNFHCPPYQSGLDTVYELDGDFRPVLRDGAPVEGPAGSTAVRDAIEKHSPTVGLHGHIHESRSVAKVGNTICINPGSDYSAGTLNGAIVNFNGDGRYVDHLLTAG